MLEFITLKVGEGLMGHSYSRTEILTLARDRGVGYVRLQFTDLLGMVKNVEIPVNQLGKALDNEIVFDGSSIEGFVRLEESDMYLHPDLSTWLVFPWCTQGKTIARLICDVYTAAGVPFAGDPRSILKRVLREAEAAGFSAMNVGSEPEFFLFKVKPNGEPTIETNDDGGYFDLAPVDLGENCRRDIVLALEEMGFEIEASHHEVAPGQHEIDFGYSDALKAADNIITFKLVVKTIARQHNLHATFMPKPVDGVNGSGMHIHQSLSKGLENAFYDDTAEAKLSATARHYLAGLLAHAHAMTAITNPLVNSYKRLIPGYEAPVYIAWSQQNRSPLVRIPASDGASTRIELRSPDPAANPYLTIAVMLKAGLDGIRRQLPLPNQIKRNVYSMSPEERLSAGIFTLPSSLEEAVQALQEDQVIQSALGEHALVHYVHAKSLEWEMYRATVHPWERNQYLSVY